MARKQLNVSGGKIQQFSAVVLKQVNPETKNEFEYVKLDIKTDEDVWEYDIRPDTRAPEVSQIASELTNALTQAQIDFSKVEIKEYKERFYLFVDVKGHLSRQYTGTKTK